MAKIDSAHRCHSTFDDRRKEAAFPIIWARADRFTNLHKRMGKKVWLGICGFSHRIFRVSPATGGAVVEMIVISDLIIDNGKCEMAKSCLARECPLNRTPESKIKKLIGKKSSRPREVDLSPLTGERFCNFFKDNPKAGGFIP